ncbi:MAG: cytochrome c3 family protein [Anaerolineae bacterium]
MFKRKPKNQNAAETSVPSVRKRRDWLKISLVLNIAFIIVVGTVGAVSAVVYQSDTNPNFCGSCHLMQSHVTSYYTSGNLDNVHQQAGVECKDCHDYPLQEEISAGINYLTSSYVVDDNGELLKRDFGDEICTQCHVSLENVARSTDFLYYNPHGTRMGTFACSTCHISHGEQIDYCSGCHTNGGQRMLGDDTPRAEVLGRPVVNHYGLYGQ